MTQPKRRKKNKTKNKEMRMKHTNLLKRSYKGYTQMFTGVRDPGHQRAQSYNYALCGPNHDSYSTGPGNVTNDGECGYRESQMVATWRPLQNRGRLFGHFGPKGVTNQTEYQALQVTRLEGGLPCRPSAILALPSVYFEFFNHAAMGRARFMVYPWFIFIFFTTRPRAERGSRFARRGFVINRAAMGRARFLLGLRFIHFCFGM